MQGSTTISGETEVASLNREHAPQLYPRLDSTGRRKGALFHPHARVPHSHRRIQRTLHSLPCTPSGQTRLVPIIQILRACRAD